MKKAWKQENNQEMKSDKNTKNVDFESLKILLCKANGKCRQKQNLMEPGNGNEIKMMRKGVESDGEEGDETIELILPITVYITTAQVPSETTMIEPRK